MPVTGTRIYSQQILRQICCHPIQAGRIALTSCLISISTGRPIPSLSPQTQTLIFLMMRAATANRVAKNHKHHQVSFSLFCSNFPSLPEVVADQDPQPGGSEKKPFTVKFGGRAGEAVGRNLQHLAYTGYSHDLQVEDSPSEWAPFSTRIDWEVARWAKLRGPSSTALSELLKIDGVCCLFVSFPAVFLNTFCFM